MVTEWKRTVHLPADEFGLDEDGWIEVRTRVTARDYEEMVAGGGSLLSVTPNFILNWKLKYGGEDHPYSKDTVLDQPIEIVNAALEAVVSNPLAAKALGLKSGQQGSGASTHGATVPAE